MLKGFRQFALLGAETSKTKNFANRSHTTLLNNIIQTKREQARSRISCFRITFCGSNRRSFSHISSKSVDLARNISFSGSGFLCVFHLGVASALMEKNIISKESKFAGASGGALVAAALGCNLSIGSTLEKLLSIAAECRKNGTVGHVGKPLMNELHLMIPANGAELCNSRVKVAVSRIWPKAQSPVLVDHFDNREDLILALKSSCCIPYYLDRSMSVKWREGLYVDGGFVQLVPLVPSYAMVVVFRPEFLGPVLPRRVRRSPDLISPSLLPEFPYTMPDLVRRALLPSSEKDTLDLFEWGRKAGVAWMDGRTQGVFPW